MNEFSNSDQEFMEKLSGITEANLENEHFGVSELAGKMGMSRSQIHRKLKSICNKSASQLIRETRLEKARKLIEEDGRTFAEVAYMVGFRSPSYFDRSFHDYFGFPLHLVKTIILNDK